MKQTLDFLKQMAKALSVQFGGSCEVVIHDLTGKSIDNSIVHIENGHVTSRKTGDGPSHIVLETLKKDPAKITDQLGYLTQTSHGKILKSSTVFVKDETGERVDYIFSINYDITNLLYLEESLKSLTSCEQPSPRKEPERITPNVNDLLDDLIAQSVALSGKPAALMNKEEKIAAIRFLNDAGAFLITRSGDKVSKFFGISKYTLYSYLDTCKEQTNP